MSSRRSFAGSVDHSTDSESSPRPLRILLSSASTSNNDHHHDLDSRRCCAVNFSCRSSSRQQQRADHRRLLEGVITASQQRWVFSEVARRLISLQQQNSRQRSRIAQMVRDTSNRDSHDGLTLFVAHTWSLFAKVLRHQLVSLFKRQLRRQQQTSTSNGTAVKLNISPLVGYFTVSRKSGIVVADFTPSPAFLAVSTATTKPAVEFDIFSAAAPNMHLRSPLERNVTDAAVHAAQFDFDRLSAEVDASLAVDGDVDSNNNGDDDCSSVWSRYLSPSPTRSQLAAMARFRPPPIAQQLHRAGALDDETTSAANENCNNHSATTATRNSIKHCVEQCFLSGASRCAVSNDSSFCLEMLPSFGSLNVLHGCRRVWLQLVPDLEQELEALMQRFDYSVRRLADESKAEFEHYLENSVDRRHRSRSPSSSVRTATAASASSRISPSPVRIPLLNVRFNSNTPPPLHNNKATVMSIGTDFESIQRKRLRKLAAKRRQEQRVKEKEKELSALVLRSSAAPSSASCRSHGASPSLPPPPPLLTRLGNVTRQTARAASVPGAERSSLLLSAAVRYV